MKGKYEQREDYQVNILSLSDVLVNRLWTKTTHINSVTCSSIFSIIICNTLDSCSMSWTTAASDEEIFINLTKDVTYGRYTDDNEKEFR